jgi:glycosyltransferase involved in cell wall biosynthesis
VAHVVGLEGNVQETKNPIKVAPSDRGLVVPLISVIMPNFNKGRYLESAIQSILSQTHHDLELIIVDDGSADESMKIINESKNKDSRIVCLRQAHNGISAACNAAIAIAKGEFIARQDSDDISAPDRLEMQLKELSGTPPSVCFTDGYMMDEAGEPTGEIHNRDHIKFPKEGYAGDVFSRLLHGSFMLNATIMAHKECFNLVRYDTRYEVAEDWDLAVRLARHFQLRLVPEVLYGYRIHENNTGDPGRDNPAKLLRLLRSQVMMQRNWVSELDMDSSDKRFLLRQVIRFQYQLGDYLGLLKVGFSSPTAFRSLAGQTIRIAKGRARPAHAIPRAEPDSVPENGTPSSRYFTDAS